MPRPPPAEPPPAMPPPAAALLSHISLDVLDERTARSFYIAGLGCVEDNSASSHGLRANAGASQIRLPTGRVAHILPGHLELWTRESLEALHSRLRQECDAVIAPILTELNLPAIEPPSLLDDAHGERLLCHDPHGNLLIVRHAPPSYHPFTHGSHPGGIGGIVALTRFVHIVQPGVAARVQAFWTQRLGLPQAELVHRAPPAEGATPTAHCLIRFSSGQQLIFDEREDASNEPSAYEQSADARFHVCIYVDKISGFEGAFRACEAAGLVCAPPGAGLYDLEAAQAAAEFRFCTLAPPEEEEAEVADAAESGGGGMAAGGRARTAQMLETVVRSVAHETCPLPRADIVAGGAAVEPPAAFSGWSPLQPPPHAKPGMIRIPHGKGGFGAAAKELALARARSGASVGATPPLGAAPSSAPSAPAPAKRRGKPPTAPTGSGRARAMPAGTRQPGHPQPH